MEFLIVAAWVLGFGFTTAFIAQSKNRGFGAWLFLGALFGLFALIAVCAMPAEKEGHTGI